MHTVSQLFLMHVINAAKRFTFR